MSTLATTIAVAIGGGLGALSRVGLEQWLGAGPVDPVTLVVTLGVNTLGALVLGLLRRPQSLQPPPWLRQGLGVGFLGAFTTWSAVTVQVSLLSGQGNVVLGIAYLLATLFLGLLAAWWGLRSSVRDMACATPPEESS